MSLTRMLGCFKGTRRSLCAAILPLYFAVLPLSGWALSGVDAKPGELPFEPRFELYILPHPGKLRLDVDGLQRELGNSRGDETARAELILLGLPQSVRRWHYRAATDFERALEQIDPFAPDVLLGKVVGVKYVSKAGKDAALQTLKSDSRF